MRSIVCAPSCSIAVCDAHRLVNSELTTSLLSPFVPPWEIHRVVVLGYRRRAFYNQHTFKAAALGKLERIFPIGNSV